MVAAAAAIAVAVPRRAAIAQAPGPATMTLADAVARARANHPALAAASARRRETVSLSRQEAAFPNPVVEWRRENLGSPLQPDVFATVAQPLDITGRRFALRARTKELDRSASADSVTVIRDVDADAARAYWRASLASALVALVEQQRQDAERLAQMEELRAKEGDVAEVVAMRTRMEHDRVRITESSARAALAIALAELARATGTAPGVLPPIAPLTVSLPIEGVPNEATVVAYALKHRSELAALDAADAAASHRLSAERRGMLPDVAVEAGTKQTAGYATRVIGVAVPVPLFNRNGAARDRAAAELDRVRADRRAMENVVRTNVTGALETYRALVAAQPGGADSLVARAADVARIADGAYAAGGATLVELLDARRAYSETLTTVLRWIADLRIAHVDLLRAVGASPLDSLKDL